MKRTCSLCWVGLLFTFNVPEHISSGRARNAGVVLDHSLNSTRRKSEDGVWMFNSMA
jgi:hypothetical protein